MDTFVVLSSLCPEGSSTTLVDLKDDEFPEPTCIGMSDNSKEDLIKRYTVFEEYQTNDASGALELVTLVNPFDICQAPNSFESYNAAKYGDYALTTDAIVAGITAFKDYITDMDSKLAILRDEDLPKISESNINLLAMIEQ
jgi:hypothetical protein